jgi:dihydroorotate dehydrogenase (NAD+) catalytic subunit
VSDSAVAPQIDLTTQLGRLQLVNPILTASGTFGYAREMEHIVDLSKLGGVLPKTITALPRPGNAPWRTVETTAGMLNAIGLDNDGIDYFLTNHWPYLSALPTKIIVSIAGKSQDEFATLAERMNEADGVAALELNISCPNVSGGVDFGTDPTACYQVVSKARSISRFPVIAKLTPNVTAIVPIAQAAADAGADAVSCINTVLGMAIDWRNRKPILGNKVGGLSGPAIKPIALRCVYQIASQVDIPIIGIGGICNINDVMEFLIAGASAVQIGTANYFDPTVSSRLVDELPIALQSIGAKSVAEVVNSLSR